MCRLRRHHPKTFWINALLDRIECLNSLFSFCYFSKCTEFNSKFGTNFFFYSNYFVVGNSFSFLCDWIKNKRRICFNRVDVFDLVSKYCRLCLSQWIAIETNKKKKLFFTVNLFFLMITDNVKICEPNDGLKLEMNKFLHTKKWSSRIVFNLLYIYMRIHIYVKQFTIDKFPKWINT